eukprot:3619569-Rhodomonas_salina.1
MITHVKSHAYGCVHQSAIASLILGVTPGCDRVCLRAQPSQGKSKELWYRDVNKVTDPWHSDVQPILIEASDKRRYSCNGLIEASDKRRYSGNSSDQ